MVIGNRAAWLAVLRACEGTLGGTGDEGYRALFGWRPGNGKVFTSFADHPRIYTEFTDQKGVTQKTSAAGAYQATVPTWEDFIRARGPHDFSPASQDEFALWLTEVCHALDDVDNGRLREAIDKCGGRWASLPSARYAQPRRTYQFCEEAFIRAGGTIGVAMSKPRPVPIGTPTKETATQPKETPTMGASLVAAFLPSVFQLFAGRAAAGVQKVSGASPEIATQFVSNMADKLVGLAGMPVTDNASALKAVAAVVDDPAKMQALEQHALDYIEKISPLLDKIASYEQASWAASEASVNAAAERNARAKDVPIHQDRAFIVSAIVLLMVGIVVLTVLWKDAIVAGFGLKEIAAFSSDMQAFVIGAIVGSALTAVISYFLGTNRQSAAKDATIETLSRASRA